MLSINNNTKEPRFANLSGQDRSMDTKHAAHALSLPPSLHDDRTVPNTTTEQDERKRLLAEATELQREVLLPIAARCVCVGMMCVQHVQHVQHVQDVQDVSRSRSRRWHRAAHSWQATPPPRVDYWSITNGLGIVLTDSPGEGWFFC